MLVYQRVLFFFCGLLGYVGIVSLRLPVPKKNHQCSEASILASQANLEVFGITIFFTVGSILPQIGMAGMGWNWPGSES
jgi:hypothetical protein